MAGKQAKRLTEQQKERLKDPSYLIALRAVKPLVRQGQRTNRQARRQERRAAR